MYNLVEKTLLIISGLDFLTFKKQQFIINNFNNLEDLWSDSLSVKHKLLENITSDEYNKLCFALDINYINSVIDNLNKLNIKFITIKSKNYPNMLKEIDTPPIVLYYKGNIDLINSDCLGVVGTRRASKYGKDITNKFVKAIAYSGITIVSGLADGIDTIAHSSALEVKGNTIAVLGSGFNYVYPNNNLNLFNTIAELGLVISEHSPNEKPKTHYFPIRNRIIAGISKGVLITEAPYKSGALITKDYALDYGKDVYSIPARLTDIYSTGTNNLIKNCQSSMVLDPEEIIENFGYCGKNISSNKINQLTIEENLILNIIKTDDVHFDEILQKSEFETKKLKTLLMSMELKGLIKKLSGNVYRK